MVDNVENVNEYTACVDLMPTNCKQCSYCLFHKSLINSNTIVHSCIIYNENILLDINNSSNEKCIYFYKQYYGRHIQPINAQYSKSKIEEVKKITHDLANKQIEIFLALYNEPFNMCKGQTLLIKYLPSFPTLTDVVSRHVKDIDERSIKYILKMMYDKIESELSIYKYNREMIIEEELINAFCDYPTIEFQSLTIHFSILHSNQKVAIYEILSILPKDIQTNNLGNVIISFEKDEELISNLRYIIDLLFLIKKYSSLKIIYNKTEISFSTFCTLYNFLGLDKFAPLVDRSDLIKKYKTVYIEKAAYNEKCRIIESKKNATSKISLRGKNDGEIINILVDAYIKEYLSKYNYIVIEGKFCDKIVIVEDLVVIYFTCDNKRERSKLQNIKMVTIQELLYNNLFKVNFSEFIRKFQDLPDHVGYDYIHYKGDSVRRYSREDFDYFKFVNNYYPELHLTERQDSSTGVLYHFLFFRIMDKNNAPHFGTAFTKNNPQKQLLKICTELIRRGYSPCMQNHASWGFDEIFNSYLGVTRRKRIESYLSYCLIDKYIKDIRETDAVMEALVKNNKDYAFNTIDLGVFNAKKNKWKSEELVYRIIKEMFGEHQVIYQFKPYFLKTERGQLSYDIFICELRVAVEYQGQQHYFPVSYFGGEDHYLRQIENDETKKRLSAENNVKLVYIDYNDDITPTLIKLRIQEALQNH